MDARMGIFVEVLNFYPSDSKLLDSAYVLGMAKCLRAEIGHCARRR